MSAHEGTVAAPAASRTRQILEELFGIDRRSLATFRVALGTMLLVDLARRARFLTMHYTDDGVLPRGMFLEHWTEEPWRISLHMAGGSAAFEVLLFCLAAAFAFALLVGYRTRLATVASWLMLYSLHSRNPFANFVGDFIILQLLFWSAFIPLGAHWSVDRALDTSDRRCPQRILTAGTVAILAQVSMMFVLSTMHKTDPPWRVEFTAIWYALNIDEFLWPFGKMMRQYPGLLQLLTAWTFVLEAVGPFIAFSPVYRGPIRTFVMANFVVLFCGIASCMRIDIIPFVAIMACIPFLPGWIWDKTLSRRAVPSAQGLRVYYDGECAFCYRLLLLVRTFLAVRDLEVQPAQSNPAVAAVMERENSWVCIDESGAEHVRYAAFLVLCRYSPVLWWCLPLLRRPVVHAVGDRVYDAIATRRMSLGPLTRWLEPRPRARAPRVVTVTMTLLCAALLLYAFLWGLASAKPALRGRIMTPRLGALAPRIALGQGWKMFAPHPRTEDGWPVMPTVLADGSEVDLFRDGAPVSWEKPEWVIDLFPYYRHVMYFRQLIDHRDTPGQPQWAAFIDYMIRQWNAAHDPAQHVREVEVIWMREFSPLPGHVQQPATPVHLYTHAINAPQG